MNKSKDLILKESFHNFLCQARIRSISSTSILNTRQAGRYKTTRNHSFPLTYEQSYKPHQIAVTKGWTSFNSSNLWDGLRRRETLVEDLLIRKIVDGFWPQILMGDVIIKRRGNVIYLAFFVAKRIRPEKIYFLTGFTEQILSYLLKCPVKLEIQAGTHPKSLVVKFI